MLTRSEIERALTAYDVGQVHSTRIATHGLVNETAFAETAIGLVVVRRNQRRLGKASISERHRLLNYLKAHGFPAPRLIANCNSETMTEIGGRLFEVFAYIEGDDFNPERPNHLRGVGRILATYHRVIAEYSEPPERDPPRYPPSMLNRLTERLLERDVMGELTEPLFWYDQRGAKLSRLLTDQVYNSLPQLLIHGDIHKDNFLFRGDAVSALLDFDQITTDARLVDLADALVGLAPGKSPEGWSPWGVYDGPLDPERARLILSAYEETAPLTMAERNALPVMIETIWLQGNLRRVLVTSDAEPDYHIEVLNQGRWLSGWLADHGATFLGGR
ncbi:MAG: homoserine kinase [Oscillochloris sp.]|nr:homoserine kinase [Oscillochloris sp.]